MNVVEITRFGVDIVCGNDNINILVYISMLRKTFPRSYSRCKQQRWPWPTTEL